MPSASALSLNDALDLFLLDCQSRRLTASTLSFYRLKTSAFIRFLAASGLTTLDAITPIHIKRWLVDMQDRGFTDHSQHDYCRAAKTFLNYCVRDELLEKTPFTRIKMPKIAEDLPIVLSDEEIKQALQRVKIQRNRLIIRFILDSGVRAAELLKLNIGDIDMKTGIVTVRLGKQQKSRYTSIGNVTRKELKRYLAIRGGVQPTDPLLIGEFSNSKRLSNSGLMSAFRMMQNESGVDNLTAHTLRRTMATKALENGMEPYLLARILGHADLQMLNRYVRLRKAPVIAASEQFSVVDNL